MYIRSLLKVFTLILFTSGISTTVHADVAADKLAIDNLYASWRQAVEHGDVDGYVAVLDPNVRLLPPDAEAIVGAANYRKFLGPVFAGATYRIEVTVSPIIEVLGDTALAEYEYTIHLTLKNQSTGIQQEGALTAERTASRYVDVLRRQENGAWGVYRHAWQSKAQ
jgi:ketosteroid isomerase-like protein